LTGLVVVIANLTLPDRREPGGVWVLYNAGRKHTWGAKGEGGEKNLHSLTLLLQTLQRDPARPRGRLSTPPTEDDHGVAFPLPAVLPRHGRV
jgi:hypothetical protein